MGLPQPGPLGFSLRAHSASGGGVHEGFHTIRRMVASAVGVAWFAGPTDTGELRMRSPPWNTSRRPAGIFTTISIGPWAAAGIELTTVRNSAGMIPFRANIF